MTTVVVNNTYLFLYIVLKFSTFKKIVEYKLVCQYASYDLTR